MADWHYKAREMSAQGKSVRQIAAELGKSRGGVQYALQPEKDNKRPCVRCGGLRKRSSDRCAGCLADERAAVRAKVESMWAAGASVEDVRIEMGYGPNTMWIGRCRDQGWNLPYRYRNTKRQRRAA